jgi:hypothetical protein
MVSLSFSSHFWGKRLARVADRTMGRGRWKRLMLPGNRVDRKEGKLPCQKQADFQRVVTDERTGRTF